MSSRNSYGQIKRDRYVYNTPRNRRRKRRGISFPPILLIIIVVIILLILLRPLISGRPKMRLIGLSQETTAQGEEYIDPGATATIYRIDVSNRMYAVDGVNTDELGTYEYTYCVDGRRRTFSISRTVEVVDVTGPDIELNGDELTIVSSIDDYEEPGVVAIDNCDGDVTDTVTSEMEQINDYTWEVTYSAVDELGNVGTAVREIQLHDDVQPEIELNGSENMVVDRYTEFEDPGVTATDNHDGDISEDVTVSGYVDVYRTGEFTLTYTATDSSGNTAEVTRTVTVQNASSGEEYSIYLTFDDGPSDDVTVEILDTLKENDIQATFFILDYTEDKLPILQRMIDEGHTIGIHGTSHEYDEVYSSVEAFMDSIDSLAEKLERDTGYEAFCMRFPGGSSNTVSAEYSPGIMSELVQVVTEQGWMYFDWNVDSDDATGNNVPVDTIVSTVESELSETTGNVVLMHDTSAKQTTAESLQTIIDYGKENGYSFYPITRETNQVHHGVSN